MIWVFMLLLQSDTYANDLDLTDLRNLSQLEQQQNSFIEKKKDERVIRKNKNRFPPYDVTIGLAEILGSPEELGALKKGTPIYTFEDSRKVILNKDIYIRFHRQPDDQGFKYLVSKNGSINFKVSADYINSIAPETVMYEPPHTYTPAPEIKKIHYDKKLKTYYEIGAATSFVQGTYLQDLLNLDSAPKGRINQIGGNVMANWKWPVKVGLGAYFTQGSFKTDGGTTTLSSISFGPVFKTKNFHPFEINIRLFAQARYSPFGKMNVEISNGETSFNFNSTDFLFGVELPFENKWGEFVVSIFSQSQWISLKKQQEIVNINSSNKANQAIGLGIAQVF